MPEHIKDLLALQPEGDEKPVADSDARIAGIVRSLKQEIAGTTGLVVEVQATTQALAPNLDAVMPTTDGQAEQTDLTVVSIASFRSNPAKWIGARHAERRGKIAEHQGRKAA